MGGGVPLARVRRASQTRASEEEEAIPALPVPVPKSPKRKKPKAQSAVAAEEPVSRSFVIPQVFLIGGLAGCAFLILALASFDSRDASLSSAGSRLVHNRAGPVGAYLADAFYQGFGYPAWSVVLVAGLLGLRLAGRRVGGIWNWVLVGAAILLAMVGLDLVMSAEGRAFPPGGLVGLLVANALRGSVGHYGAAMLVAGASIGVATALFRIDWQPFAEKVVTGLETGAPRVARRLGEAGVGAVKASVQAGAQGAQAIKQHLEERRQAKIEDWGEEEEEEEEEREEPASRVEVPSRMELSTVAPARSGVWSARPAPPPPIAAEPEPEVTAVAERALVEVEWEPTATADGRGIPRPLPPSMPLPHQLPKSGSWAIPLRPEAPVLHREETRAPEHRAAENRAPESRFPAKEPPRRGVVDLDREERPAGTRRDPRTLAGFGPEEEYTRRSPKVEPPSLRASMRPPEAVAPVGAIESGIRRAEVAEPLNRRAEVAEPLNRRAEIAEPLNRRAENTESRRAEFSEPVARRVEVPEPPARRAEVSESYRRAEVSESYRRPENTESRRIAEPAVRPQESTESVRKPVSALPPALEEVRRAEPVAEPVRRVEVPEAKPAEARPALSFRRVEPPKAPAPPVNEGPWGNAPEAPPRPLSPTAEIPEAPRRPRGGALVVPGNLQSGGTHDDGGALRQAEAFALPPLSLMDEHPIVIGGHDDVQLQEMARKLTAKLKTYGVEGRVVAIRPGPVITLFEYEPAPGVKLSKISSLSDDLKMALEAVSVRIVAPIPGRGVVGVEIPNRSRQIVWARDVFASKEFRESGFILPMILGKDTEGRPFVTDLAKMPHLLVGGTTGSGKSVGINTMLCSLLYTRPPSELRMILVDPKMLEFELYQDIPHLLHPVVTEAKLASAVLKWACVEMDDRYRMLAKWQTRNIEGYNQRVDTETQDWSPAKAAKFGLEEGQLPRKLPYIVIVIDELADLMMVAAKDVEESIVRLAQKARAAGVHLIVATQRPSVDVITGLIKANMPSRLAYQVRSKTDGRTILDQNGAETLLGKGDLLFLPPGSSGLIRAHGPFLADEEVRRVSEFLKDQGKPDYAPAVSVADDDGEPQENLESEMDENYDHAVAIAVELGKISTSMIQRRLKIGYNRAARMMEIMEREGVVGPADGAKPREVLLGRN